MGISWEDRVSNTEVLRRAEMSEIEALIMKAQLRWVGQAVVRMDDARLQKVIFFSELASGARNTGRPLRRYKDSLKTSLEACGISARNWESLASDCDAWRPAVQKGVRLFKEKRLKILDQKRQVRLRVCLWVTLPPPASLTSLSIPDRLPLYKY
ncbi:Hypothetical predicted protein [Octopus vulgaris]|uniref:Uncharacterized protein n=1 Tax=Octopus vulgaris TaxID=6645 RepID=A0AA36FA87_OCTVU|nr:Hypothetical predicted protein [Octopus vulgaris]